MTRQENHIMQTTVRIPPNLGADIFAVALLTCSAPSARSDESQASPFDGKSLAAWTTLDGKPVTSGWEVVDGAIHLNRGGKRIGHIVTAQEFGDFDLLLRMENCRRRQQRPEVSRARNYGSKVLGCEYQVFDDRKAKKDMAPRDTAVRCTICTSRTQRSS